ncbi:hypothetical protein JW905_00595, partial [bacterium]|nr:hypothetical protein [candidate division CSSED10-310 bacterium]
PGKAHFRCGTASGSGRKTGRRDAMPSRPNRRFLWSEVSNRMWQVITTLEVRSSLLLLEIVTAGNRFRFLKESGAEQPVLIDNRRRTNYLLNCSRNVGG